ncbi:MAG: hypothetical protein KDK50_06875, partial [Chlamydiia bacterium]|nr:hypothetical protein [Chlamydiia bacterium]
GDPEPLTSERWNYGAIVKDSDGNQLLYYPKNVVRATGEQLLFDNMWSADQLGKGPSCIEVQEVGMRAPLLDWEEPEGTIPLVFLIADTNMHGVNSFKAQLHAVEVVISGEKAAQKVANTEVQTQVASLGQSSPKPATA